jgi:hypothetical protein
MPSSSYWLRVSEIEIHAALLYRKYYYASNLTAVTDQVSINDKSIVELFREERARKRGDYGSVNTRDLVQEKFLTSLSYVHLSIALEISTLVASLQDVVLENSRRFI